MISERRLNQLAMLAALSLFMSTIEYLFPRPVPFMRLGLANLPVMLCLDLFDTRKSDGAAAFFLLVLLKVLGQGISF